MDEAEIAAALAAKVNNPIVNNPVAPVEEPEQAHTPEINEDDQFTNNLPLETVIDKMKLQDYFEIPVTMRRSPELETQLNRIVDWARSEARSGDYPDMLRIINDQERIMGIRNKDNRVYKLYQYVTINTQRKALMERERALYG